jgi:hypothetical protein
MGAPLNKELKYGDTRADGYRFVCYRQTTDKLREAWLSPEAWDKGMAYRREYLKSCPERRRATQKAWRKKNPQAIAEGKRRSRAKNPILYLSQSLHNHAKQRAKAAKIEFSITREWVTNKLNVGKCEMTGRQFVFQVDSGKGAGAYSPSLDRIEPRLGYTPENTRLILWGVNCAKNKFTDDVMKEVAHAILNPV